MSRCRCLYIAPNHNAKSIKIDENQDILINTDVPNWSDYQHLQPHIIHYTGSNPDIMLLVQKLGAACLRWQPSAAVMLEVSGLKRINLQLALNEPFVLRCDDASFAEIHLAHGCDYFAPTFGQGLPHMVLKADARTGRLPPLPALHHATHLTIEHPWQAHFPTNSGFDCRQLLPFGRLNHLVLNGHMTMWSALGQFPLHSLEIHNAPDLRDFPELTQLPALTSLTLNACEAEGGKHIHHAAKQAPDLMLYYMSTLNRHDWQQLGYDYSSSSNTPSAEYAKQLFADGVCLDVQLDFSQHDGAAAATDKQANNSLLERMSTESVGEFFGFKHKNPDASTPDAADTDSTPSLFERMRTESVGDFFRKRK